MLILIGSKSQNVKADVTVLYAGNDGNELTKAIEANAGKGFVRMVKICHPMVIPVRIPDAPVKSKKTAA